ncbi:MAG: hypothetical protein HY860_06845 [Chlamydiales bacterium]|nr:hypothetical protein [Chlamydiales bacterium]
MKTVIRYISMAGFVITTSIAQAGTVLTKDITKELPEISTTTPPEFQKIVNVAQYKAADWNNVVGVAKDISLEHAYKIANDNPDIDFFFYTKGGQMVLEKENGEYRVFRHGDTVFFSGTPWWGSAPGLADGYIKARAPN